MSRDSMSAFDRAQLLASIERVVQWFRTHDSQLAAMSFAALPDGYPGGGGGGGRSKGDHSDPTCSTLVARTDGTDDASVAFARLQEAFVVFAQAQVAGRRALPPADDRPPKPRVDDQWCTSCARVRDAGGHQAIFTLRTTRKGGRKDLCDWCQGEWLGVGKRRQLPDQRLVMAHYALSQGGRYLTSAHRSAVLAMKTDDVRRLYIDAKPRQQIAPEKQAG